MTRRGSRCASQDDDDPPDVSVAAAEAEEGEAVVFTVTLSRESSRGSAGVAR